jgi:hypothetical protein
VTFLTINPNKIIMRLRHNVARSSFRTTVRHYADK